MILFNSKFCFFLSIIFLVSCASSKQKDTLTQVSKSCIDQKISEFSQKARCQDAQVMEYLFQQKTVFVFEQGTCVADMTSQVVNSDCVVLGHLGGIMGNTKINGKEFSTAELVKIRWKK